MNLSLIWKERIKVIGRIMTANVATLRLGHYPNATQGTNVIIKTSLSGEVR